jgi:hypothetical protein
VQKKEMKVTRALAPQSADKTNERHKRALIKEDDGGENDGWMHPPPLLAVNTDRT